MGQGRTMSPTGFSNKLFRQSDLLFFFSLYHRQWTFETRFYKDLVLPDSHHSPLANIIGWSSGTVTWRPDALFHCTIMLGPWLMYGLSVRICGGERVGPPRNGARTPLNNYSLDLSLFKGTKSKKFSLFHEYRTRQSSLFIGGVLNDHLDSLYIFNFLITVIVLKSFLKSKIIILFAYFIEEPFEYQFDQWSAQSSPGWEDHFKIYLILVGTVTRKLNKSLSNRWLLVVVSQIFQTDKD